MTFDLLWGGACNSEPLASHFLEGFHGCPCCAFRWETALPGWNLCLRQLKVILGTKRHHYKPRGASTICKSAPKSQTEVILFSLVVLSGFWTVLVPFDTPPVKTGLLPTAVATMIRKSLWRQAQDWFLETTGNAHLHFFFFFKSTSAKRKNEIEALSSTSVRWNSVHCGYTEALRSWNIWKRASLSWLTPVL